MGYTIVRILQKYSRLECRIPPRNGSFGLGEDILAGTVSERDVPGGLSSASEKGIAGVSAKGLGAISGVGGAGKSSVWRMADARQVKYKSEIVLQPEEAVRVAFWE